MMIGIMRYNHANLFLNMQNRVENFKLRKNIYNLRKITNYKVKKKDFLQ